MDTEKTGGLTAVSSGENTSGEVIHGIPEGYGETKRGLSPRHVQLMAIGGSIGTGLWVSLHLHIYPGAMTHRIAPSLCPRGDDT